MNRLRLHETIGYRPMTGLQELSTRRRRSFWALSTSIMSGNGQTDREQTVAAPRSRAVHPSVREIHKNAWLKRQTSADKKGTPFTKKGEKFWVVFCVHDDVEAFLEFYSEPKMGTVHKPLSAISLNSCQHVSSSIMGQENEYQFVVALKTEVIRLVAANWEQMIEWVESLQGKLREMNILSPKDNLYSKLPELKPGLAGSTRDPNSPLPPTPNVIQATSFQQQTDPNFSRIEELTLNTTVISNPYQDVALRGVNAGNDSHLINQSSRLSINGNTSSTNPVIPDREEIQNSSRDLSTYETVFGGPSQQPTLSSEPQQPMDNSFSVLPQSNRKARISVEVSVNANGQRTSITRTNHLHPIVEPSSQQHHRPINSSSAGTSASSTTLVVIGNGDTHCNGNRRSDGSMNAMNHTSSSASVTIRCSSSSRSSEEGGLISQAQHRRNRPKNHRVYEPVQTTWSEVGSSSHLIENSNVSINQALKSQFKNVKNGGEHNPRLANSCVSEAPETNRVALIESQHPTRSENVYEHIFLSERPSLESSVNDDGSETGINSHLNDNPQSRSHTVSERRQASSRSTHHDANSEEIQTGNIIIGEIHSRRKINESNQRSSSVGRIELPVISSNQADQKNENMNGQIIETVASVGNSSFFTSLDSSNVQSSQLEGNPIDAVIGTGINESRLRQNENGMRRSSNGVENDNQRSVERSNSTDTAVVAGTFVPLKEQQVLHLQMEINHPGGVRITLRKKDCINSIAFVDYLGAVWVAGWKQTQFPVLYYAFHVGDQILKVAGVSVQSSQEAIRSIKMVTSSQVEFIVRRLPYGRVFAIRRSREGEPLGLVAEGSSGEISEVLPDGLASRFGLPPHGLSLDGHSPCNWYLTEVNNRPLSLMSKENEVKDRLNAVGKEISLLVQPTDLVKNLKKNLKSYKGFRDYIVG